MNRCNQASVNQWRLLHDEGYFDRHSHTRNRYPVAQELTSPLFTVFLHLQVDDDVLDIGCGYGSLLPAVADRVRSVVGIDVHEAPLSKAREILKAKTNARVVLTDGLSLPFDDNSFSAVYSYAVMQHIPRSLVRIYISEAGRVLKSQGRLCMQFPDARRHKDHVHDIDVTKPCEQSTAWTAEELLSTVNGVDLKLEIYESPPHNLYLVGIAEQI